jgi:hypothetical protein
MPPIPMCAVLNLFSLAFAQTAPGIKAAEAKTAEVFKKVRFFITIFNFDDVYLL